MWLAAWKLVSNDAKRTVAPPNAKHSTLPQGCFLCFLFFIPLTIRQQCRIYPQECSTEPAQLGDSSKIWCRASERVGYDDEEEDIHITTDPLRGSYCVHFAITKLRVLACEDTCMVFRIIWHLRCLPQLLYQFPIDFSQSH